MQQKPVIAQRSIKRQQVQAKSLNERKNVT